MKNSYIFRHPEIRIRAESFGGLAQTGGVIFMLGRNEYASLNEFHGYRTKKSAEKGFGSKLLRKLLTAGLLVEIDAKEARKILKEKNLGKKGGEKPQ